MWLKKCKLRSKISLNQKTSSKKKSLFPSLFSILVQYTTESKGSKMHFTNLHWRLRTRSSAFIINNLEKITLKLKGDNCSQQNHKKLQYKYFLVDLQFKRSTNFKASYKVKLRLKKFFHVYNFKTYVEILAISYTPNN